MVKLKQKAIQDLLKLKIKSSADLMTAKRQLAKKYKIGILNNSEILKYIKFPHPPLLKGMIRILRKRAVRTMSGIAPVAVLVKPFACPGKCAYCPTEKNVPQSYLSNEPAVMRAIGCDYDPYKQVQLRLRALEANGHEPTKIELIVIGGTWSVLPEKYKFWYIANLFAAANDYQLRIKNYELRITNYKFNNKLKIKNLRKRLFKEQKRNEKARYKIIGLTLETRPDYIFEKELLEMRELGCTRVELGVQAVDDKILEKNKRGHGVKAIADATKMLRDFGFKITYHIMPGLPGSTAAKDLKMFKMLFTSLDKLQSLTLSGNNKKNDEKLKKFIKTDYLMGFNDERFQPDQIKFYPTVVTRGSLLYKWWKDKKYKPYSDVVLQKLIVDCKKNIPEYVRIIRLVRDIPKESIVAGNKITNLRQVMKSRGVKCRCIRCREARDNQLSITNPEDSGLRITKYKASGGEEYFIQAESKDKKILYGFCRLSLRESRYEWDTSEFIPFAKEKRTAIIRELHVYGELVPVGSKKKIQHAGLGKKLMAEAEKIARENGYKKIAVISGVGARGYYRKLGYKLKGNYMVKFF